ncbi:MAG: hypothetical protein HQ475_07795 [SAR202 cluster bacterium]|nr:hypothetical protein [SAR202 cluster bacterium]
MTTYQHQRFQRLWPASLVWLSSAVFPDASVAVVQASDDTLRAIMEG